MSNLTLNLDYLKINRFGTLELRNEVYLLALGADLSGIGAHRAPAGLFPENLADAHPYLLASVSPLFVNVQRGDALNLLGDGLNLYGPKDPCGKLCLHVAIMESDSDHRRIAKRIDQAFRDSGVSSALEMVGNTGPWQRVVTIALRLAFEKTLYFLKLDDDDVIDTLHYSSTDRPGRGYCTGRWGISSRYVDAWISAVQDREDPSYDDIADPSMVAEDPYAEEDIK